LINRRSGVIKSINFNVIDSSSARMLRGAHEQDGVQLPFEIAGKTQIEVPLAFAVEDSHASHQLRGVVTFMAQNDEGLMSDKLDFKLRIPCSVFLTGIGITGDLFTELLAGPELTAAAKLSLEGVSLSQALDRLSQELKLAVIEMDSAGMSASMYARHCTNHHVCLLIKTQTGDRLSVCGKSSSQALLGSVMDEIQKIAQSS